MRASLMGLVLAALVPAVDTAQVVQFKTPNPDVTAAIARWQVNDEPIVVQGLTYFPTREKRMFDGQVMTQIDVYGGVPVYADTTIEPFALVYVPLTRDRMRTYERPHDPNFALISGRGRAPLTNPPEAVIARQESGVEPMSPAAAPPASRPTGELTLESIPRPSSTDGVWVEFGPFRWYSDGAAVSYDSERFVQIGSYRNFPVYGERGGAPDRIWIPVLNGGPLAPYRRRG